KVDLSMRTVIVGHTTFCIVVVFNNVLARLRRVARSMEEASADLGASGWQTFRYIVFPTIRTALVAGGLLALPPSLHDIAVPDFLDLPPRPAKPRDQGVTHVIDTGLSTAEAEGLMASAADYVDLVRLGWGSAYVTHDVRAKVERYQAAGVPVMLGGTLTELA